MQLSYMEFISSATTLKIAISVSHTTEKKEAKLNIAKSKILTLNYRS